MFTLNMHVSSSLDIKNISRWKLHIGDARYRAMWMNQNIFNIEGLRTFQLSSDRGLRVVAVGCQTRLFNNLPSSEYRQLSRGLMSRDKLVCVYVYACVFVCVCMCVYACVCVYLFVCVRVSFVCLYMHYICMCVYVCYCVRTRVFMCDTIFQSLPSLEAD